MTPLNGHAIGQPSTLPEPAAVIAERLYGAQADDGDTPWLELEPEEREGFTDTVRLAISLHMGFLNEHGFKIVPPGAVLRPKSDEEAAMMAEAVRLYGEAKKRKGGLLTGERKLILPKGAH
jgi:hypothetical protein